MCRILRSSIDFRSFIHASVMYINNALDCSFFCSFFLRFVVVVVVVFVVVVVAIVHQ